MLSILSLSVVLWVNAQEKDSLKQKTIDEVIITGQFMQQSIDKSIYKVEVIDAQQIKNMAVTNVAEVLNQNLNILIEPSKVQETPVRILWGSAVNIPRYLLIIFRL